MSNIGGGGGGGGLEPPSSYTPDVCRFSTYCGTVQLLGSKVITFAVWNSSEFWL